jgi:hypothetical protein
VAVGAVAKCESEESEEIGVTLAAEIEGSEPAR